APARVPDPGFPVFRAAPTPDHRPEQGDSGLPGVDQARDARPGITGVLSQCAGRPTPPSPCVFTQVREGSGFRAAGPGARGGAGAAIPPPRPAPTALPHPTDQPVPTAALAARLNPPPARRRTRLGRPTAPLPPPSLPA